MPTVPFTGPGQGPRLLPQGQQDIRATPAMFGALQAEAMGQASRQMARASDRLAQVAIAIQDAQNTTALTDAQTRWTAELAKLRGSLEMEPDPAVIQQKWQQGTQALRQQIEGSLGNAAVRQSFAKVAATDLARDHLEIVRLTARRTREVGEAKMIAGLSTLAQEAAANPSRRAELDARAEGLIASNVAAGIIPADKAEEMRQRYFGRLDQAEAMRDIAANPMVALRNLADPNKYRGLDPVARQRLANSATSAMQAQATAAEAAERRAERVQRRLADQAANDLYARIALAEQGRGPMPTVADVQAQREWLSPGETAALLARIRAATHRDDPGVRLDLERDVDRVDPVAFDARVRRAVDGGQLTAETAANLLRANRAARRDDAPPSPIAAGRAFVRSSLDPGDVPMAGFMREQLTLRQNNAISDFDRWARENPNASADEADAQARAIVSRYRDIGGAQLRLTLPKPYGFTGTRQEVTEATIQEAARRLLAAGLPEPDLRREMEVLEAWRSTFVTAPQPRSNTAPPGRGQGPNTRRQQ